jgi:hypothetical protein
MGDGQDVNLRWIILDSENHPPITDAVTRKAFQFIRQAFDVVVSAWVAFQLLETSSKFGGERLPGSGVKGGRFGSKNDLKHPIVLCAS